MRRREDTRTHEHDPLVAFDQFASSSSVVDAGDVWLADAMRINPPSWLEAIAIVQGVSGGLGRGQMPPMLGEIVITPRGTVRFPPGGVADHVEIAETLYRLLDRMLGTQIYPMDLWLLLERVRTAPSRFAFPGDLAAALGRLVPYGGPARLAAYVLETAALRRHHRHTSARPAPEPWFLRRPPSSPE